MRIQTEYTSFKIIERSVVALIFRRTCSVLKKVFPDCSTVTRGAPRFVTGAPWFVTGAPSCSQACPWCSQMLPAAPKVLSGTPRCSQTYHNHSHGTPVAVIRDPRYSEGRQECPPMVWYSPEIDTSKFTLHILSDTPGVFQWLKYILLMLNLWRKLNSL